MTPATLEREISNSIYQIFESQKIINMHVLIHVEARFMDET
jgi:hypothetical protein